ncbi:MAG: DNA-3-methyladenine glycosylase I [Stappiaceae bacterium]
MRSFDELYELAANRKGGVDKLETFLGQSSTLSAQELGAVTDDRWLAQFTKCIFQAGFNWKVVESKWEGFEEAFDGFSINRISFYSDDDLDRLISDTRIVRHGRKIRSVFENALFLRSLAEQHGSAGQYFAKWPDSDYVGLLDFLKKNASRLGGNTGQYALRFIGKPSFILSRDVIAALQREAIYEGNASSKKNMRAIQNAFNTWAGDSGRNLTVISRVLAMSVE